MATGYSAIARHECTICLEKFKRPKLLPCFHTFCAQCLGEFIEKNRKGDSCECPLCRNSTKIPRKGVEEFQTNFYVDDITDTGTKDSKKFIFCTKHPRREIEVICKECDEFLCLLCMLKDHKGHTSRDIIEEAREVRESLQSYIKLACVDETKQKQSDHKKAADEKTRLGRFLKKEMQDVVAHGRDIHQSVDSVIERRKLELKQEYTKVSEELDKTIERSETCSATVKSLVTSAKNILEHGTEFQVIKQGISLCRQLDNERKLNEEIGAVHFVPNMHWFIKGRIDSDMIDKMVGSVETANQTSRSNPNEANHVFPINNRVEKVSSLLIMNSDRADVSGIAPISKDRAWVAFHNNTIIMIDSAGKTLLAVDVGAICYHVTSDENDSCIITCPYHRRIKRVTKTGKIEELQTDVEGLPYGVAYRRTTAGKEEILFSCDLSIFNVFGFGGSSVFVAEYRRKAKAAAWAEGFKSIIAVAVDKMTGNVCICDKNHGAKVTVLDENGHKLAMYEDKFSPFDICFDSTGCILFTANDPSKPVIRIKPDASLAETLTSIIGKSVAVDCFNNIWTGGENGYVARYEVQ